jgi:hypothetical protein
MPLAPQTEAKTLPELSQYALGRLDQCARLFELAHLQRVSWPAPDVLEERDDLRERLAVGDMFHRLVNWHARGHDVAPLLALLAGLEGGDEIARYWRAFERSEHASPQGRVWSEQTLRVSVAGQRVMARYDRVVAHDDGNFTILDWKTGQAFDATEAARSWQTRLYRLVLAEGGHALTGGAPVAPERVKVVYWHVPTGTPHSYPYSRAQRDEDLEAVEKVGDRLRRGVEGGFAPNERHCGRCPYTSRCQLDVERPRTAETPLVWPTFRFPD